MTSRTTAAISSSSMADGPLGAGDAHDHRVDAADQVGAAGGGVVVGRVVERLDGDAQRRVGRSASREYSFLIDDFANIDPEPTDW